MPTIGTPTDIQTDPTSVANAQRLETIVDPRPGTMQDVRKRLLAELGAIQRQYEKATQFQASHKSENQESNATQAASLDALSKRNHVRAFSRLVDKQSSLEAEQSITNNPGSQERINQILEFVTSVDEEQREKIFESAGKALEDDETKEAHAWRAVENAYDTIIGIRDDWSMEKRLKRIAGEWFYAELMEIIENEGYANPTERLTEYARCLKDEFFLPHVVSARNGSEVEQIEASRIEEVKQHLSSMSKQRLVAFMADHPLWKDWMVRHYDEALKNMVSDFAPLKEALNLLEEEFSQLREASNIAEGAREKIPELLVPFTKTIPDSEAVRSATAEVDAEKDRVKLAFILKILEPEFLQEVVRWSRYSKSHPGPMMPLPVLWKVSKVSSAFEEINSSNAQEQDRREWLKNFGESRLEKMLKRAHRSVLSQEGTDNKALSDVNKKLAARGGWQADDLFQASLNIKSLLQRKTRDDCQTILQEIIPDIIRHLPTLSTASKRDVVRVVGDLLPTLSVDQEEPSEQPVDPHKEQLKQLVLENVAAMPLDQREIICEAFHQFLDHDVSREMALCCEGIPPNLVERLNSHANQNVVRYAHQQQTLYAGFNLPPESRIKNAFMASILESVHQVSKDLDLQETQLAEFLGPLVRTLASRLSQDEKVVPKASDRKVLADIAGKFFPKAKETLEILRGLEGTPIGSVAQEAKKLLMIDGKTAVVIETIEGGLKDSWLLPWVYDCETGYANGFARAWKKAMQLAVSEERLTAADIAGLYEIIADASHKDLHLKSVFRSSQAVDYELDSEAMTEDGLSGIKAFMKKLESLQEDGVHDAPKVGFKKGEDRNHLEDIEDPSYADRENLWIYSFGTSPALLEKYINFLLERFYQQIERAETADDIFRAMLEISRELEWLHASEDSNGRVCGHLIRNICLIIGLRKLGMLPYISTPFDAYQVEVQSIQQGVATLKRAEGLSRGTETILNFAVATLPRITSALLTAAAERADVTPAGLIDIIGRVKDLPNDEEKKAVLIAVTKSVEFTKDAGEALRKEANNLSAIEDKETVLAAIRDGESRVAAIPERAPFMSMDARFSIRPGGDFPPTTDPPWTLRPAGDAPPLVASSSALKTSGATIAEVDPNDEAQRGGALEPPLATVERKRWGAVEVVISKIVKIKNSAFDRKEEIHGTWLGETFLGRVTKIERDVVYFEQLEAAPDKPQSNFRTVIIRAAAISDLIGVQPTSEEQGKATVEVGKKYYVTYSSAAKDTTVDRLPVAPTDLSSQVLRTVDDTKLNMIGSKEEIFVTIQPLQATMRFLVV